MTQYSRHLPFPVSDVTDLRRAIRYVLAHNDADARRFVLQRARALGHTDLIPSTWRTASQVERPKTYESLEHQFESLSKKYGIGVAKLKAVYFRGVKEFQDSDAELGSATMYGLARVQRFINAVFKGAPMLSDQDLLEQTQDAHKDPGVEISIDTGMLVSDVLYASGTKTGKLFRPGNVHSIKLEDSVMTITGELDGTPWTYSLDTVSGEHELHID